MNATLMSNLHRAAAPASAAPWAWKLARNQASTLAAASGMRWLRVDCGQVWLTQADGQQPAEDIWLQAGQSIALPPGSRWVLEGWPQASVSLLEPPGRLSRAGAWLRRLSGLAARLSRPASASPAH